MLLKTRTFTVFFLLLISIIVFSTSCGKNEAPPIDVGYVNFYIYPNSTEYLPLNNVGGYAYVTANAPSRGIIIYRLSIDEFKAFERTPTYKPDSCCISEPVIQCTKLIVDESMILAVDTCSGSKYLLLDGSIVQGPAPYPMVQYQTRFDGEILNVYN